MFDFIFKRNNPTKSWTGEPNLVLSADLTNFSINGIKAGASFEKLSFMGPCDCNGVDTADYHDFGILFHLESNQTFSGYSLDFSEDDTQFKPYKGVMLHNGAFVSPKNVVSALGEPYWIDKDEYEILQFFEFGSHEIQCELTLEGAIVNIIVTTIPLMSDPEQRDRYGVTKPWPI